MKHTTVEQDKQNYAILGSKHEIDNRIDFYKTQVENIKEASYGIEQSLKKGYKKDTYYLLGFIPVIKKTSFTDYEMAKMKLEKSDLDNKFYYQTEYLTQWLERLKEYETKFDEITRECNEKFEVIVQEAYKVVNETKNPRLAEGLNGYFNDKIDKNDQKLKNEFYLYIKKEVGNYYIHTKKSKTAFEKLQ